jgi:hypothetical protein
LVYKSRVFEGHFKVSNLDFISIPQDILTCWQVVDKNPVQGVLVLNTNTPNTFIEINPGVGS